MSDPLNPHAPHISDGPDKQASLDYVGKEEDSSDSGDWLKRAREAYTFSTSFVDANYRKKWDDSIRAFNSEHSMDSKYNSPGYDKRSKIYRPKTRTIIRKNESALATALFSNMDAISTEAMNQGDKMQVASAEIMKELVNYRLTTSIPWFQVSMGGLQDAQTQGVVVSHNYWMFSQRESGKIVYDKPCIDLIPIENIRFDSGADWTNPIETSPYVVHLIPMYVGAIKEKMIKPDPKGQRWKKYGDGVIRSSMKLDFDPTRNARSTQREDRYGNDNKSVSDYEIAWVMRHIHQKDGVDWHFYTLGTECLLTDPIPLDEVVFHGKRPYTMGYAVLETHKVMPSSVATIVDGLQKETNEIANQRLDNIKLVLNKRYFVKRGKNVDIASLVRNVPGAITMADDPELDIKESSWPDVTSSSYEEQGRLDNDFNELVGNFSPMDLPNRKGSETAHGMALMEKPANMLTEYMLRTFIETWVEPTLRQLVKLEQFYETDQVVLNIAADKVKLYQRYGMDKVTDDLLNQDLTIKVNVGMGSTDPQVKLQRFLSGIGAYGELIKEPPPGMNLQEVGKEIFGHLGYQDGRRFFTNDNPEVAVLEQKLQQMQQMMQQLQQEALQNHQDAAAKVQIAQGNNQTTLIQQQMKNQQDSKKIMAQAIMEHHKPVEKPNGKSRPN